MFSRRLNQPLPRWRLVAESVSDNSQLDLDRGRSRMKFWPASTLTAPSAVASRIATFCRCPNRSVGRRRQ